MSANTITEHGLLTEVPEPLKRLTRIIIRGFYGTEAALVVDLLVRNACMKEEDMVELLKFDRKLLRSIMNSLKSDKFIKVRICVETDAESKTTRHNIYFINYTMFVNVVKYKLDHMRRKIESDERDSTNRASFKCPRCGKTFTDLEVNELFDPISGAFICTYCQMEVEEDGSSAPKEDSRTLLVRFNDQIQPIYSLLKECEDFKLAPEVLEPELTDLKTITGRDKSSKHKPMPGERTAWSGDQTKNRDFNYKESTVTISMDETDKGAGLESVPQKERPVWMVESTIEGVVEEPDITQNSSVVIDAAPNASAGVAVRDNEDIMRTLIVHEKKSAGATGARPGSEESSSSESEEDARGGVTQRNTNDVEEMMDDDDDDEDGVTMVTVGDKKVSYHDVTEDMVATMTQSEKEAYIKLGQEMYKHMYE